MIEVTDTGIGMTEEELERVYERFYQADSGRARMGGGLGLGLSIVSGFVSLLGGFMIIKSKPEVGTTVHVSLPQKVVDASSCMSVATSSTVRVREPSYNSLSTAWRYSDRRLERISAICAP